MFMMEDLLGAGVAVYHNLRGTVPTRPPASSAEDSGFPVTDYPVWILGRDYSAKHDLDDLITRVESFLWLSYRSGFPEIGSSGITSDRGWGCMLRCGQMMMAEALSRLYLGQDWVWTAETSEEQYLDIIKMMEDHPEAPFSIHQISLMGQATEGKSIGTWFGPNTIAQVLKKLACLDPKADHPKVHIALDNMVVIEEIKETARSDNLSLGAWNPVILVIPLRLGLTEINPVYFQDLKEAFELKQCIGVIGGKPNHALYFIGYVDDEILCLDPHQTQATGLIGQKSTDEEKLQDCSYHQKKVVRFPIDQLDPSLALCFFSATEADFDELCQNILRRLIHCRANPLFELCRKRPAILKNCIDSFEARTKSKVAEAHKTGASGQSEANADESDEEFEIL